MERLLGLMLLLLKDKIPVESNRIKPIIKQARIVESIVMVMVWPEVLLDFLAGSVVIICCSFVMIVCVSIIT